MSIWRCGFAPGAIVLILLASCSPLAVDSQTQATFPTQTDSPCTARADFGDPESSPYVLPYPVGKVYRISQSYCSPDGSHANQQAYDFAMPVGVDVSAARAGRVVELKGDSPDTSDWEEYNKHNYLIIQHQDGSAAFYAHLKQDSLIVEVGDWVEQGQLIAKSGNSGFTGFRPQLHFGVYRSYPLQEGQDLSVNFSNAEGPLDSRGGLIQWRSYEALPYP